MSRLRQPYEDDVYRLTGERLREMRRARGLTMDEVARGMKVSQSSIHNAEIGQTCSLPLLHRFADFFDCSLDDLSPVVTEVA